MSTKTPRAATAPKWDTSAYLAWRARQFAEAFALQRTNDNEAYAQAWDEFRTLLDGLITDENFWHVSHALRLLPHLLEIRQQLDVQTRFHKRMEAGMKGAATRQRREQAKAQPA